MLYPARVIACVVLISTLSPHFVFSQGLKGDKAVLQLIEEEIRERKIREAVKRSEQAMEEAEGEPITEIIDRLKSTPGVSSVVEKADGSIVVSFANGRSMTITDKETTVREEDGTILQQFENSKIGKYYGDYVHFLFQYIIPATFTYHVARQAAKSAAARGLLSRLGTLGLRPFFFAGAGGGAYLFQTEVIDRAVDKANQQKLRENDIIRAAIKELNEKITEIRKEALNIYNNCKSRGGSEDDCFKKYSEHSRGAEKYERLRIDLSIGSRREKTAALKEFNRIYQR